MGKTNIYDPYVCILYSQLSISQVPKFILTLKVPIRTAADNIHKYFFIVFQRKYDLMFQVNPLLAEDLLETSGLILKNQALFSSKGKSKKLKCCLLQFLFGTLRVKLLISQSKSSGPRKLT